MTTLPSTSLASTSRAGPAGGTSLVKVGGVFRAQEVCEGRGGRPGLSVPNSPYGLRGRTATLNMELRSSVKVDVAILGSPSLRVFTVSVKVVLQQVFHL